MRAKNLFPTISVLFFALVLVILWHATPALAQEKAEKSLYERLGGAYPIATVVDDFIERLLVNDTLNANPRIKEARERVPKAGLKYRVTSLVCQATGGPEVYTGRSMKESHKHLLINEREWQALLVDFKKSLDKFGVPEREQKELFAIVESTKQDIVVTGALDGKIFVVETGEQGKPTDLKDVISFKDARFHSSACDRWGFGDGLYTTSVRGDTITFEAETFSPKHGKMLWKGTVKGNLLEETHHWTKEGWFGKIEKDYWGQGKLKM